MTLTTLNRLLIVLLLITGKSSYGSTKKDSLPFNVAYYKDNTNKLKVTQVDDKLFVQLSNRDVLNLGVDDATFWIKLSATKDLVFDKKVLFIEQGRVKSYEMYKEKEGELPRLQQPLILPGYDKVKNVQGISYLLPDTMRKDEVIYLKLKSHENFIAKISIVTQDKIVANNSFRDVFFGIYTGVMLIMFIYNLFLFIVVRDKSYIHYVFYILFTWLTQISIQGYGEIYIWNSFPLLNSYSVVLCSLLALLFADLFTISFLNTKVFAPRAHKAFITYIVLILLTICCIFLLDNRTAFMIMQFIIMTGVILRIF